MTLINSGNAEVYIFVPKVMQNFLLHAGDSLVCISAHKTKHFAVMFIEALEEKQIDIFYITFFIYTADVSKKNVTCH